MARMEPTVTAVWEGLIWLLLRLFSPNKTTREHVHEGRYEPRPLSPAWKPAEMDHVSPAVLELAKELYRQESDRGNSLRAKGGAILDVSRVLIPTLLALGAFVSPMLVIVPLTIFFLSLILLVELHRAQWDASPAIDDELLRASGATEQVVLADSYMRAARTVGGSNDFLASVLAAAHRVFGLGLAATIVFALIAFRVSGSPSSNSRVQQVSVELSTATMKALAQGTLGNEGASESRATPAAALPATPSPLRE